MITKLTHARLLWVGVFLSIATTACENDEKINLNGTWLVQEPPELMARINRADGSVPVFDIVFTINSDNLTQIDLLIDGATVDGETGSISYSDGYANIKFSYQNFQLSMAKCRPALGSMLIGTMSYTLPDGSTDEHNGITIGTYN